MTPLVSNNWLPADNDGGLNGIYCRLRATKPYDSTENSIMNKHMLRL